MTAKELEDAVYALYVECTDEDEMWPQVPASDATADALISLWQRGKLNLPPLVTACLMVAGAKGKTIKGIKRIRRNLSRLTFTATLLRLAVSTRYQALRAADPTAMDGDFPLPVVAMIEATHYAEAKKKGIIP